MNRIVFLFLYSRVFELVYPLRQPLFNLDPFFHSGIMFFFSHHPLIRVNNVGNSFTNSTSFGEPSLGLSGNIFSVPFQTIITLVLPIVGTTFLDIY